MSVIISIQQEIAAAIAAVPFFSNIPVIAEVLGDLPNQYQIAMDTANASGGKVGAIVIVHTPLANVNFPDMRGPYFDQINVVIEVGFNAELAKISGTGIGGTAMDICENVIVALCAFFPQAANGPLVPVSPTSDCTFPLHSPPLGPKLTPLRSCRAAWRTRSRSSLMSEV